MKEPVSQKIQTSILYVAKSHTNPSAQFAHRQTVTTSVSKCFIISYNCPCSTLKLSTSAPTELNHDQPEEIRSFVSCLTEVAGGGQQYKS